MRQESRTFHGEHWSSHPKRVRQRIAGLRQGLEKLGWVEGSNLRIDYRFAPAGAQARLLARELIALQPDVVLTQSTPATVAMQQETRTIPIVFSIGGDPVEIFDPMGKDVTLFHYAADDDEAE